jgi:hypothetical protein
MEIAAGANFPPSMKDHRIDRIGFLSDRRTAKSNTKGSDPDFAVLLLLSDKMNQTVNIHHERARRL